MWINPWVGVWALSGLLGWWLMVRYIVKGINFPMVAVLLPTCFLLGGIQLFIALITLGALAAERRWGLDWALRPWKTWE